MTVEPVSRDQTQVNSPQDVSSEVDHSVRSFFAKEEGLLRVEDNASPLVDPEVLLDERPIFLGKKAVGKADKAVFRHDRERQRTFETAIMRLHEPYGGEALTMQDPRETRCSQQTLQGYSFSLQNIS